MGKVRCSGVQASTIARQLLCVPKEEPAPVVEPPKQATKLCVSCGSENPMSVKFCTECGAPAASPDGWKCSCGAVNKGRFCSECGSQKPAGVPQYRCDKCGWEPEDVSKPPKFCPECGDIFDDGDIK